MRVLQVKQYHSQIADKKKQNALERWGERGYGCPVDSMFYYMREDCMGYPTAKRQNGYVAFDENRSGFGMTPEKAIEVFNR